MSAVNFLENFKKSKVNEGHKKPLLINVEHYDLFLRDCICFMMIVADIVFYFIMMNYCSFTVFILLKLLLNLSNVL